MPTSAPRSVPLAGRPWIGVPDGGSGDGAGPIRRARSVGGGAFTPSAVHGIDPDGVGIGADEAGGNDGVPGGSVADTSAAAPGMHETAAGTYVGAHGSAGVGAHGSARGRSCWRNSDFCETSSKARAFLIGGGGAAFKGTTWLELGRRDLDTVGSWAEFGNGGFLVIRIKTLLTALGCCAVAAGGWLATLDAAQAEPNTGKKQADAVAGKSGQLAQIRIHVAGRSWHQIGRSWTGHRSSRSWHRSGRSWGRHRSGRSWHNRSRSWHRRGVSWGRVHTAGRSWHSSSRSWAGHIAGRTWRPRHRSGRSWHRTGYSWTGHRSGRSWHRAGRTWGGHLRGRSWHRPGRTWSGHRAGRTWRPRHFSGRSWHQSGRSWRGHIRGRSWRPRHWSGRSWHRTGWSWR